MHTKWEGSEVILMREGRAVTCFRLDLPAGMLVEQIATGKRKFKRFGQGEDLSVIRQGGQVFVWAGTGSPDLDRMVIVRQSEGIEPIEPVPGSLTGRQRQVLDGLAHGDTLGEIGYRLGIRKRSVRHHVDALKRKLDAVSLSELVARAVSNGLLLRTPPQGGTGAGWRSDHPKKH